MSYAKHNYKKGDELLASQLNEMDNQIALNEENIAVLEPSAAASDVGKFLKVKKVVGGKATQYEFDSQPMASDTQVTTAVDAWLENNVAQETGYVLDRTLSISNAAAPADLVRDINDDLNDALTNGDLSFTESINIFTGFNESGKINGSTGADASDTSCKRSEFIHLKENESTLYVLRNTQPYQLILFWYDTNKQFMSGANVRVFTDATTNLSSTVSIPSGAEYVRTYRVASASGDLQFSYTQTTTLIPVNKVYEIKREVIDSKIANWSYQNTVNLENIIPLFSARSIGATNLLMDYEIVKDSPYSLKLTSGNGTTQDVMLESSSSINLIGIQKIVIKFFAVNAGNMTGLTFRILGPNSSDIILTKDVRSVTEGWNEIVCQTAQNSYLSAETWTTFSRARVIFTGTGAFSVYLSAINIHRMDKAKLIFVDDHGYRGFKELAYPRLKAVGQPVTWALNPGRLGVMIDTQEQILTQEDIDELAYDAFSEFSFHNWNPIGNTTETMTPDELRQDFQKCITYLKKNGICPTHLWRAAYTQNKANNWWVAQDMIEATACHDDGGGFDTWPFTDRYNVHRYGIHNRASTAIDSFFETLKLTHCTLVLYTHGCVTERTESDNLHCTVAEIEYLCNKISTGVSEGWLEPTTYNRLATMKENGMYTLSAS